MRTVIAATVTLALLTGAVAAFAADAATPRRDETRRIEQDIFVQRTHATLTYSPYYRELRDVNEQAEATEQRLLAELRVATDETEIVRLVARLERVDIDRELGVLKVQARYAHNAGMLDLERKIRARILDLLEEESQ